MAVFIKVLDEDAAIEPTTRVFEFYLALRDFIRLNDELGEKMEDDGCVRSLQIIFKEATQKWLEMARERLMRRITKAVEVERTKQEDGITLASSALDVSSCITQIIEFWQQLDWPDKSAISQLLTKLTDDVCQSAVYYSDVVHDNLKRQGFFEGRCGEEACVVTLNNLEHVRRCVRPLSHDLKFAEVAKAVDGEHGDRAGRQTRARLNQIVRTAEEDIAKRLTQIVDTIADRTRLEMNNHIFHLCWAPSSVKASDAISPLMNFLDSYLLNMNQSLYRTNLDRVLTAVWNTLLDLLREASKSDDVRETVYFERLRDALQILSDFFHVEGRGLPIDVVESEAFKGLLAQVDLSASTTYQIIERYFKDKMGEQTASKSLQSYGTLTTRVYYNADARIIQVEVLNASNIIALDSNGLSDPFVEVQLEPQHLFPQQPVHKTKIIRNSLHPVFEESFEFDNVSLDQCRHPAASVHFTVMDHDFMMANDFAGELFVKLAEVPGAKLGDHVPGVSSLNPHTLPLTQPRKESKSAIALSTLNDRSSWDKQAAAFVKRHKHSATWLL